MKIKSFLLLLLISVAILPSCKKDPCSDVVCINGFCDDGTCACFSGYAGTQCETSLDPCNNIVCQNGGNCINGACSCPTGYSGAACETAKTPSKITITKIVLNQYPPTNGGAGWDPSTGPDIYVEIDQGSTNIYSSGYISDVSPGNSYTYSSGLPISMTNPNVEHTVWLVDYESAGSDTYMGGLTFTPTNLIGGFPSTIKVFNTSFEIDVDLHVTYTF